MTYHDEAKMVEIRSTFEKEVQMERSNFQTDDGCFCYFYNRKFIGFLVTHGIVIMKLLEEDQTILKEKFDGKPFEMAGQTGRL